MEDRVHLRPTPEQYRAFCDHLCGAHSWYKHLPLIEGNQFVVFAAADAGSGRLVLVPHGPKPDTATEFTLEPAPDGPAFTDEHPRLHYAWRTTKEYRRRFGYLDYMWRGSADESYARDAGPPLRLPQRLVERCGLVLYPYMHERFLHSLSWKHDEAIEHLRAGAVHPAREELLELARLVKTSPAAKSTQGDLLSKKVRVLSAALRAQEVEKIRRALAELDDWLLPGKQ